MNSLQLLTAREQLMEDIGCIIESNFGLVDYKNDVFTQLCDAVCSNFPIASPYSPLDLTDIMGYLAENHTHLAEQQIKDVSPTIQDQLSYEGMYEQIDTLVLYLLGILGDSEQTPPE